MNRFLLVIDTKKGVVISGVTLIVSLRKKSANRGTISELIE